jgi:tetratricopeptide (TPR) repeat protein
LRTIAPALAVLAGVLSAVVADSTAALERLSDEVRTVRGANRPLALSGRGNEAVLALLQDAERELRAGRPEQASIALERALRIEPRNPTVWHYLGLARLDLGAYAQAEVMASRSHSLAPADRALRSYNARLVATARQASGQTGAPLPDGLESWADESTQRQAALRTPFRDVETWRSRDSFGAAIEPPSRYTSSGDGRSRRQSQPLQRECRIWYPDRPPNRQPPPFKCDEGTRHVPPGAVLLVSI